MLKSILSISMPTPSQLLHTLPQTWQQIASEGLPAALLAQIQAQNPWFTPYYVQKSMDNIAYWWAEAAEVADFLATYPIPCAVPQRIGIITAGNVPLVGFHDVLMVLLSGNIAVVSLSHQDDLLLPYIAEKWAAEAPFLRERLIFSKNPERIAGLIATGSDTTARFLENQYADLPKIIRKNRFSMAYLSEADLPHLGHLCEDILLFNGMGCRNVSNVIVDTQATFEALVEEVSAYDRHKLSALYLQKVQWERARLGLAGVEFVDAGNALFVFADTIQQTPLSVVNVLWAKPGISYEADDIQCVVGKEVALGQAQQPKLWDFADGVDTLQWLVGLGKTEN